MNKRLKKTILISLFLISAIAAGIFLVNKESVNPQIVEAAEGENLYITKDAPFEAMFGNVNDLSKIVFKKGDSSLTFKIPSDKIEWKKEEDTLIADAGEKAYSYQLIKNDGKATGLKEEIILKEPTKENKFEFSLQLQNLKYQKESDGIWHFFTLENEPVFFIPKPYMEDAEGNRSENIEIQVENDKLFITVDKNWLLSPERKYPVSIDPSLRLSIITVHSHPQAGDNWIVDFETEGTADLKIIPDNQATIEDIDFISLTCDGRDIQAQILENDVISVPNWQCPGTGTVTHLVNVAAPHRLKFDFGGEVAYAYNAPGSTTYTFSGVTQASNDYFAYEDYGSSVFTGPDDTGTSEATDTDYSDITSDNSTRWQTALATTDGNYDAQLYKFYITESESVVTQLDFKWNGYGTTTSNYNTTLYAYDYDGSSWTQLSQVDFTASTDQDLTFTESTSPGKFIDTDGEVTLMAHASYAASGTDTIGPNSPSTAAEDTSAGSTSWTSYTNVYSSNDSDASVTLGKGSDSYYIKATNFGFSYNYTCTSVDGITVEVEKASSDANDLVDYQVYLVNGSGTIVGNNKADTTTNWSTTDGYVTYGGSADTWGASLTCTDITNSNFGVVFSAQNVVPNKPRDITAYVDHIRITIDYSY